jgi:hypothetical protein
MEVIVNQNVDKICDVINVLTRIKENYLKRPHSFGSAALRKEAIKELAEAELRKGRYKNLRSALYTLQDACRRRLEPNIIGMQSFDWHVNQWLYRNSMSLREVLLQKSYYQWQKQIVCNFFENCDLIQQTKQAIF